MGKLFVWTAGALTSLIFVILLILKFGTIRSPIDDPLVSLKTSAEQGNIEAQAKLGELYRDGTPPVSQDKVEAMYWFKKAAYSGHILAQTEVGFNYAMGIGTDRDLQKALEWCEKAGQQGHIPTQITLGSLYTGKEGVAEDPEKSFYWTEKAAQQGSAEAQFQHAVNYMSGYGTARNQEKFLQFLEKSAAQGFEPAVALKNQVIAQAQQEARMMEAIEQQWRDLESRYKPTGRSAFSAGPNQYVPPAFRDAQRRFEGGVH